jgi:hypothetical protein
VAVVEFDPAEIRERRPELAGLTDGRLEGLFDEACLMVGNGDDSSVPYDPPKVRDRKTILMLVVCHLATMDGWAAEGRAGPVTAAAEGSVSVSFAAPASGSAEWWGKTPCGQSAWEYLKRRILGGLIAGGVRPHPWG